ncbi:hypothetical protein KRP22_008172 [Phytophthora ramorum]|nr:Tomoregulin-2 [Phytophthora ramorum]
MPYSMPLRSAMMLTMLLLLHGLLPSVEGTTSSLCDSSCADEDSPVCGTNGVTYRNFCFYMNAACNNKTLSLAVTDACPGYVAEVTNRPRLAGTTSSSSSMYSCNNTCNKDLSPVCASDGQTYTNPCEFNAARCHADGNLWVLDYKPCSQIVTSRRTCGGKRCTGSQQCMMELESETKFCADTCTGVTCTKDKVCALRRSTCDSKRCPPQAVCS